MPADEQRTDALIGAVPRSWQKISAEAGAHRPREYHWTRVPLRPSREHGRRRWLLARRSLTDSEEIAYYACYGPPVQHRRPGLGVSSRWYIEECFQQGVRLGRPGGETVARWLAQLPGDPDSRGQDIDIGPP
jgi:hypothetical protein